MWWGCGGCGLSLVDAVFRNILCHAVLFVAAHRMRWCGHMRVLEQSRVCAEGKRDSN